MYSLTIHFGPNAMVWSFMFKEKPNFESLKSEMHSGASCFNITDDFGQNGYFRCKEVHGMMLEDLDLVEEARIQRSLYNARGEVKARQRAATDATIRQGMGNQGASVLTPFRQ